MKIQWFKNGDHPEDNCGTFVDSNGKEFQGEGKVVRYFRHPLIPGTTICGCGNTMKVHGWIDSPKYDQIICPGDFIVKDSDGSYHADMGEGMRVKDHECCCLDCCEFPELH